MRVEIGVDKRAYQIGVINFHRLNDHPVLETDEEENIQVITDPPPMDRTGWKGAGRQRNSYHQRKSGGRRNL